MAGRELWDEMCEILKWHNHPMHCCIDTVNRLLHKHPVSKMQKPIPQVARKSLDVSEETWSLDQLWTLIHPVQVTPDPPNAQGGAIVVLRLSGVNYLMDGRRRINEWKRTGVLGPHRVLILREAVRHDA